jgi:hypothetical protein
VGIRANARIAFPFFTIGAGLGAVAGAGIGAAVNGTDSGSVLHLSSPGKPAAVGAAVGAVVCVGIGALVGHSTDFSATTLYKR